MYASSVTYAPNNQVNSLPLGNTLTESTTFNTRFQPTGITVGAPLSLTFAYGTGTYGTGGDNGNLQSQVIQVPTLTNTQTYSYDGVNRLFTFKENGTVLQGYSYDTTGVGYGNRWISSGSFIPYLTQTPQSNTFTNNQWNPGTSVSNTYDLAGNQTSVYLSPSGTRSFTYDAENRQLTASILGMSAISYAYDGEGRRVQKTVGTTVTTYVYDAAGNLTAEYGGPADPIGGTSYLTADHLGSTRLVTNSIGAPVARYDYAPFGEELTAGIDGRTTALLFSTNQYPTATSDGTDQKFTGKERDAESGLDWFETRYLSSAQGRFSSPDEPFAGWDQHDPQSFNLYSYVENNPLRSIDPDGRDCIAATNQTQTSVTVTVTSGNCSGNAANQTYVAGTVNMGSLTYNGTSIGFSYSSYDPNTTLGAGTVNLGPAPSDALSASAQHVLGQAGTMASDGSVIRGGALWMGQFLAMLDGGGGELQGEGGVVIGKMPDLDAPGGVRPGERQLDLSKNMGNPKANWAQNSSKLRQAMAEGKPIRDASAEPLVNGRPANNTGFLRAERNLLENHGWTYSGGYWNPPAK